MSLLSLCYYENDVTVTNTSHGGKTAGIKKLRQCHHMYRLFVFYKGESNLFCEKIDQIDVNRGQAGKS